MFPSAVGSSDSLSTDGPAGFHSVAGAILFPHSDPPARRTLSAVQIDGSDLAVGETVRECEAHPRVWDIGLAYQATLTSGSVAHREWFRNSETARHLPSESVFFLSDIRIDTCVACSCSSSCAPARPAKCSE